MRRAAVFFLFFMLIFFAMSQPSAHKIMLSDINQYCQKDDASAFYFLKDSLSDGHWVVFGDDTTSMILEGDFCNSKRNGYFRNWYPNGVLGLERYYLNGQLSGPFRKWNDDGTLIFETYLVHDQVNGYTREYYPNGILKSEELCEFDIPVGVRKTFYPNGNIETLVRLSVNSKEQPDTDIFVLSREVIQKCYDSSLQWYCEIRTVGEDAYTVYSWYSNGSCKRWVSKYSENELKITDYYPESNLIFCTGMVQYSTILTIKSDPNNTCNCTFIEYTGFLKSGEWIYYDCLGNIVKKEYYIKGELQ